MLTGKLRISELLLPSGAAFLLAAGCQSTLSGNDGVAYYSSTESSTVHEYETREGTDGDHDRARMADRRTPVRTESSMVRGDNRRTVTRPANAQNDNSTAAEQRDRVTIVTSKPPPPSRIETPSHEPRDGEFWVAGQWRGESGDYRWQDGHVERDRQGQLYVPANWAPSSRGWEYTPEFWR